MRHMMITDDESELTMWWTFHSRSVMWSITRRHTLV